MDWTKDVKSAIKMPRNKKAVKAMADRMTAGTSREWSQSVDRTSHEGRRQTEVGDRTFARDVVLCGKIVVNAGRRRR